MNVYPSMSRKFITLLMALTLCWTAFACGGPSTQSQDQVTRPQDQTSATSSAPTQIADGQYPVQQATYDDANGEYTLFLLDTPPGTPPSFRSTNLQMARLTDAEVNSGQQAYLKVGGGQTSLHIPQDFRIEYVHNVTENQANPETGQPETVVVGQQSSFWTPFAGALAGQAIGSLLFRPQYYMPPIYQPGGSLTGFGGYGSSYGQAVQRYQSRYQAPPVAVRNRQTRLRTTGGLRSPGSSAARRNPGSAFGSRSTGSGYGGSNLRQSERARSQFGRSPSSFGSGQRSTGGRRSFSRGRRR